MRYIQITVIAVFILLCSSVQAAEKKQAAKERPKIGLVLSGGGAKGLAHIGVLKVLEELGIRPDYITGTSMGSIVGGLYASGYSADELARFAVDTNWDSLLADDLSRRDMPIDGKDDYDKYMGSMPLKKWGIEKPKGYKRGHRLASMLSMLTLHVHHISDFNCFPIPFLCIGTDVETGKAVLLNQGRIADAMRASMAIPGVFTPADINGRLLIDGGVVRNLPVSDVKKMGADIVIAVDVGAPLYKKNELLSFAEIMDQAISFLGAASTKKQRQLADVLVKPDITGFNASDFKKGAQLIEEGEKAARKLLQSLNKIAKQQKQYKDNIKEKRIAPLKKVYIKNVRIHGLKMVSKNLVFGKMVISLPVCLSPEELMNAVNRLYASQFFESVTFTIEPAWDGGHILHVYLVETSMTFLKLGFSYDLDYKAALLFNITFRNLLGLGSKLSLDARLSENPSLWLSYFIHTGWQKPGIGFGAIVRYDKYDFETYDHGKTANQYNYHYIGGDLLFQIMVLNSAAVGFGVQKDLSLVNSRFNIADPKKDDIEDLNYFAFLRADTLNQSYYPHSGTRLYGEIKWISDNLRLRSSMKFQEMQKYMLRVTNYIPVHKRITYIIGMSIGALKGNEPYYIYVPRNLKDYVNSLNSFDPIKRQYIPYIYMNYLGGLYSYREDYFPFLGLDFMQVSGKNIVSAITGTQIEVLPDKYIVLRGNVARVKNRFFDLLKRKNYVVDYLTLYKNIIYNGSSIGGWHVETIRNDIIYGYGLTFGINTVVGPVELTLMQGKDPKKILVNFSIGFHI